MLFKIYRLFSIEIHLVGLFFLEIASEFTQLCKPNRNEIKRFLRWRKVTKFRLFFKMSIKEVLSGKNANDCIDSFAENFGTFCTNKDFIMLPPDFIEKVLENPKLKFGEDEKTTQFFLALFNRNDGVAQYFSDYVPFDEMNSSFLVPLKDKLAELGLIQESKRFERIISMKRKIEEKTEDCEKREKSLQAAIDSLEKSTEQMRKTSQLEGKIADSVLEKRKELDQLDKQLAEEEEKFKKLQKKILGVRR